MSLLDQGNDNNSLDESKNYLEELVGEGKKFKDHESLARGKAEADLTIEVMKKRMDELRNDYQTVAEQARAQAKLQDLIDRLENKSNAGNDLNVPNENDVKQPVFDPAEIEKLIAQKISQTEIEKKAKANYDSVQAKLKERFGNNYPNILKERAAELGLDATDIDSLAMKSPTAFFNTLGLNDQRQTDNFSPPHSSQRTDQYGSKQQKRTWSYYQELKKANPKLYFDPKIANQMVADMAALGDDFKDGDWNRV